MTTKEIFASNLRVKKEELGLSRGQIAIRLGKKQKTIDAYFEGRAIPSGEDLPKFIEVMEIKDFYKFLTKKTA